MHRFDRRGTRSRVILAAVALLSSMLVLAVAPASAVIPTDCSGAAYTLTLLHNNDGESQVVNAGSGLEDFGGAARFAALVDTEKAGATTDGVVMVSSGDNFLAGPEFTVGLNDGTFYDAVAMELIGYDAVNFGNHDFDFGPDVLADFIAEYTTPPPYLGANLDFSAEPALQAFVTSGVIVANTVVTTGGDDVGFIGVDTPTLPFVSSPGGVTVDDDLVGVISAQVTALEGMGVDKIVLLSHLQNIANELALVPDLSGIDVVVAGGGDELLANAGDSLIPGDDGSVFGAYPQTAVNDDGTEIPIVTTSGEYKYLGRLVVGFNAGGEVMCVDDTSGPLVVSTAAGVDGDVQSQVVDPVVAGLDALDDTVLATSQVDLDGRRDSVRFMETNEGNLIADSLLWKATQLATTAADVPDVALQNSGGIRNNTVIDAGELTVLDTFDMLPFLNFLSLVRDVPRDQFKEILENVVSCVLPNDNTANPNCGTGRFAQIAGFEMVYDPAGTPLVMDDSFNVVTPGSRVKQVTLDDGTPIVVDGAVVSGPAISIATIDFLANGGDQYPFRGRPFELLGSTYQQALADYLSFLGTVTAADYPEGGEGRIQVATEQIGLVDTSQGTWRLPVVTPPQTLSLLADGTPFFYGNPDDFPMIGDWDCDGTDTPGLYRQSDGFVYLRNSNTQGIADIRFFFGNPDDVPLAGDFDGDGCDTVSLYRPATQQVFVINELGENDGGLGAAELDYVFGNPGDIPFVGDFDGDGIDTIGLHRPSTGFVYYRNTHTSGVADNSFFWGDPADIVFAGDWDSDGIDTPALFRPSNATFYWRNSNTAGFADDSMTVTVTGDPYPVAGHFG